MTSRGVQITDLSDEVVVRRAGLRMGRATLAPFFPTTGALVIRISPPYRISLTKR
jgi:hypothetical protein